VQFSFATAVTLWEHLRATRRMVDPDAEESPSETALGKRAHEGQMFHIELSRRR